MTQPAFMCRPWHITPCPSVHAGALLYMDIILTASKLLRKAQYIVCSPVLSSAVRKLIFKGPVKAIIVNDFLLKMCH